jgi:hypothetical protein
MRAHTNTPLFRVMGCVWCGVVCRYGKDDEGHMERHIVLHTEYIRCVLHGRDPSRAELIVLDFEVGWLISRLTDPLPPGYSTSPPYPFHLQVGRGLGRASRSRGTPVCLPQLTHSLTHSLIRGLSLARARVCGWVGGWVGVSVCLCVCVCVCVCGCGCVWVCVCVCAGHHHDQAAEPLHAHGHPALR